MQMYKKIKCLKVNLGLPAILIGGAEIKTVNKLIKFVEDDGENDDVCIELIDFDNGSAYDTNTANMQWKMWYVTKKRWNMLAKRRRKKLYKCRRYACL